MGGLQAPAICEAGGHTCVAALRQLVNGFLCECRLGVTLEPSPASIAQAGLTSEVRVGWGWARGVQEGGGG